MEKLIFVAYLKIIKIKTMKRIFFFLPLLIAVLLFSTNYASANTPYTKGNELNFGLPHRHTVGANIGFGAIVSRIETPFGRPESKGGFDWRLEYDYLFDFGLGVGAQYSGFIAPLGDHNVSIHYLAPSIVGRLKHNVFIFKFGLGAGYFHFNNGDKSSQAPGFSYDLGMDYMVNEKIGVGFSFHGISSKYTAWNRSSNTYLKDKEGISRINLELGIRYYF